MNPGVWPGELSDQSSTGDYSTEGRRPAGVGNYYLHDKYFILWGIASSFL